MSAAIIPASELVRRREERERLRQERRAFAGSILDGGLLDDEPDHQPVCVASDNIKEPLRWQALPPRN